MLLRRVPKDGRRCVPAGVEKEVAREDGADEPAEMSSGVTAPE